MDVASLLRLLRDLLPPQAYANIAEQILWLMENTDPDAHARISALLMEWVRQYYPQYQGLLRAILQQVAPAGTPAPPPPPAPTAPPPAPPAPPATPPAPTPPANPTTPPRGARLVRVARVGGYVLLAYLFVAAVADRQVTLTHPPAGRGACAITTPRIPLSASSTSYGPKSALDHAMSEVRNACATRPMNCQDNACPTCGADAAITSTDISTWVVAYTATVTAICQCWCK